MSLRSRYREAVSPCDGKSSGRLQERVCKLYFQSHDIERIQTVTDSKTGETYTAPRINKRYDAVLTQMPGWPANLSTSTSRREDPKDCRKRLENSQLKSAISESVPLQTEYF